MTLTYKQDYFLTAPAHIIGNKELREPQVKAYKEVYRHFVINNKDTHAILVLPTGVGKTGLMGILPYGIANGRVLIITPQLVIKDAVLDSLDPLFPGNFWLTRKVFSKQSELPTVIEFDTKEVNKKWFIEALHSSNIVILNIHKLQKRLSSSLLNIVDRDFFDMIIIDEAHHSTAKTWVEAINYFSNAKIIKLTGTPYRTDGKEIVGELVYKYKLSAAMANGYVKSLERFKYVPDELFLTIDDDDSKKYTVNEIFELGIKDEEWVSRSVAYSIECSEKIVDESIKKLEEKLRNNNKVPHKIIAVACSIKHAIQIKELYEKRNYKCALIHSKMSKEEIEKNLKDIENHRVHVVINVAMLGEGYDHPYLSIAAIFRPFRHPLPYAQFIGRILRIIPPEEATEFDNVGQVVSHEFLYLDKLWEYYKNQIQESEIIAHLTKYEEDIDDANEDNDDNKRQYDTSIGKVHELGKGKVIHDTYLETELIRKRNEALREQRKKIEELRKILGISEEKAKQIIYQATSEDSELKRPDIYFKRKSKDIDERIKQEIVPELIVQFKLQWDGDDLKNCPLFKNTKYEWIAKKGKNNAAFLSIYFNYALTQIIGAKKSEWVQSDLEIAERKLEEIREFVEGILSEYTGIELL